MCIVNLLKWEALEPAESGDVQDADANDETNDDDEHHSEQRQIEDAAVGLHPAALHRPTEHPQHPVIDVDRCGDEQHAVERRQRVAQHPDLHNTPQLTALKVSK